MKLIFFIFLSFTFLGCGRQDSNNNLSFNKDSLLTTDNKIALQTGGDEVFCDFLYRFFEDRAFQITRDKKRGWNNNEYPWDNSYNIYIYPSEKINFDEFERDFSVNKTLSIISPPNKMVRNFCFIKENNKWFLSTISSQVFNNASHNDFISFLYKFSKDSLFMVNHIKFPLKWTYLNPEEDYSDTTVYLTKDNIFIHDFFDNDLLRFIHNGDILNKSLNKATIFIRGIDNGIHAEYYFSFINNEWFLVEENDFST